MHDGAAEAIAVHIRSSEVEIPRIQEVDTKEFGTWEGAQLV